MSTENDQDDASSGDDLANRSLDSDRPGEQDQEFTRSDSPDSPQWAPGVIHVEFKESRIPLRMLALARTGESLTETHDLAVVDEILARYSMVPYERTFPISSRQSDDKVEADRDRFITFYAPATEISDNLLADLRSSPDVACATLMPRLAPPSSSPLCEPILGDSGKLANNSEKCRVYPVGAKGLDTQWYIFRCQIDAAWNLTTPMLSGNGVVLADLDWGFRTTHQDLRRRIEIPFNTIENNFMVSNGAKTNHGTAVLGLAGAAINQRGMAGIAYEANLWAIQAGDDVTGVDVLTEFKTWIAAIDLIRTADSQGRRKVLMLEVQTRHGGNAEMALPINKAIIDAINAGVVVCVAAGNKGRDANIGDDGLPICATGSILVGATEYDPDETINRRAFSNFGPRVTVYAPGDAFHDVTCSDQANDLYTNCFGGTSGATAKVGGVVALMLEANDKLTHQEIEQIFRQTGSPITDDQDPQGIFLDARQAVKEALRRVP